MGSPESDRNAAPDEKPQHEVTISKPFLLGKYEVTQDQWKAVMGGSPYETKRTYPTRWNHLLEQPGRFITGDKPATVSWNDAREFIRRLNALEGHGRYRLPTEAEWEYACRAGTATRYSFGDDSRELTRYAWHGQNFATGSTHPVGGKEPNAWGFYDMHGNVWEWVQDYYARNYYAESPVRDPRGPSGGSKRVVRGGSWHETADDWRAAFRKSYDPDYRGISIGFRMAMEATE